MNIREDGASPSQPPLLLVVKCDKCHLTGRHAENEGFSTSQDTIYLLNNIRKYNLFIGRISI